MERTRISSTDGFLTINSITGAVISIECTQQGSYLKSIKKIDILEYKTFYGVEILPNDIDILDVGYWYYVYTPYTKVKDATFYESACSGWRNETIELRSA